MSAPTRPVIRYHGGKWRLAPWIISHLPAHRTYVEPYCGAASVLMRKGRSYAEVINDLDHNIVTLFKVLRDPDQAAELERLCRLTPYARAEFMQAAASLDGLPPVEQARRLIFRSFAGFGSGAFNQAHNTGFRGSVNRSGTHPAGDWQTWPDNIAALTARLAGVVIEHRPALDVIRNYDGPDTLYYVDPPYPHGTRYLGDRSSAYSHEMDDADHIALSEVLHQVRGAVVLSGYRYPLYDELYQGWERTDRGAFADGARSRTESLWLSPSARQPRMFQEMS